MGMREKFKSLSTFKKGFAIYVAIWLVLILAVWFVAWNYAAAYEMAQPKGAMNAYIEDELNDAVAALIADYSADRADAYQSAEQISADLTEKLLGGEWTYRKSKEYTSANPVYVMYCGETRLGTVDLAQGKAKLLDFGLMPWEIASVTWETDSLEKPVTIVAPVDCKVMMNGVAVKAADETAVYYPDFAEYEATIRKPLELAVYHVPMCIDEINVDCGDLTLVEGEEPYTYYAIAQPDELTVTTLETLAPQFAEAYLRYTSNAGDYYSVTRFVAPGSELLARLYKSRDGMSWVHYTTGKILKCEVGEIEYFGNAATYDVEYVLNLKSGEMAGNMHVVCVHADFGWRVTDIELF